MPTDLDLAWFVFAVSPQNLTPRMYRTYVATYDVDRKIERMRRDGQWPPRVAIRDRWPDLSHLMRLAGQTGDYALTLGPDQLHMIRAESIAALTELRVAPDVGVAVAAPPVPILAP